MTASRIPFPPADGQPLSGPALSGPGLSQQAPAFAINRPAAQTLPVVFASPHSGTDYSTAFRAASRLPLERLRKSEDSFIPDIFRAAPDYGAPLIQALFPRAFIDPNRQPFELDPDMFAEPLPDHVVTSSPRIAAGIGTIARVVATGEEIYRAPLTFAEAAARVETFYRPYHQALRDLVAATRERFGWALLVDCHSMPSIGGPMDHDSGRRRVEFVLGDRFGTACDPRITHHIDTILTAAGRTVVRNLPYAGGFTTETYGRPDEGVHAIQIEINRALYMDEEQYRPTDGMAPLQQTIEDMIGTLAAFCGRFGEKPHTVPRCR